MGTIVTRKRKDGSIGYMARVRIMRDGARHSEVETFDRKADAQAWMKRRETELAAPGAIEAMQQPDPTLAEIIDMYLADARRKPGKTKSQVLRSIKAMPIGGMKGSKIDSKEIVAFAKSLGGQPQTVGNYMAHLASIFVVARPAWGVPLDQQAMNDARVVAKNLGITSKSLQRTRRPTLEELDKLMEHFGEIIQRRPTSNPMQYITAFAIFSTRRLEEITRIAWADLDVEGKRVLVRDMKNPGEKIGNNVWCDLPQPALDIIRAMPRTDPEIFPFGTDAIGAAFTRAAALLGIDDLHFHDLRHDGVSRLFEMGSNIPQVAAVSGHRSWTSLKRYTHLRQVGDKYAGWKWLPVVTTPLPAIERKTLRGAKWYEKHAGMFNPAAEPRGRRPERPKASN